MSSVTPLTESEINCLFKTVKSITHGSPPPSHVKSVVQFFVIASMNFYDIIGHLFVKAPILFPLSQLTIPKTLAISRKQHN